MRGGVWQKNEAEIDRLSLSKRPTGFLRKPDIDLLELNDALELLASTHPEHCKVVELRFFGGMTIEETAEALGLSQATVERHWNFARAWLRQEMSS